MWLVQDKLEVSSHSLGDFQFIEVRFFPPGINHNDLAELMKVYPPSTWNQARDPLHIDFQNVQQVDLNQQEIVNLVDHWRKIAPEDRPRQIAITCGQNVSFGMARMFQTLSGWPGLSVFRLTRQSIEKLMSTSPENQSGQVPAQ